MQISLTALPRKIAAISICVLAAGTYTYVTGRSFLGSYFAEKPDHDDLQRAIRMQPRNAESYFRLGRYYSLVQQSPADSIDSYKSAVALNPHEARYWLDLAAAYQFIGNTALQRDAVEHAVDAAPTTPDVAWEAGNFYIVQGDDNKALEELKVVLANDPSLAVRALQLCWRIQPDVETLMRSVIPSDPFVYSAFLNLLVDKDQRVGAARVWATLVVLNQPIDQRYVLNYIRYLIAGNDPDQARRVWKQAATLSGLQEYQPTSQNLIVNGDFGLDILNGGFDWVYRQSPDVTLALDPSQPHSGHRSLRILFDSQGIEDAGIRQVVPVEPNSHYTFSAYFKAEDIEGAGGPRFAIQDLFTSEMFFASEELKGADYWKSVNGFFTTGRDTRLIMIRIQRFPPHTAIKGKLWIDGVTLTKAPS